MPATASTRVSSHCFCSLLRLWCTSMDTLRPPSRPKICAAACKMRKSEPALLPALMPCVSDSAVAQHPAGSFNLGCVAAIWCKHCSKDFRLSSCSAAHRSASSSFWPWKQCLSLQGLQKMRWPSYDYAQRSAAHLSLGRCGSHLVHALQEGEQDVPQRLVPGSLGEAAALADDHRE